MPPATVSSAQRIHILDGDAKGGGHRSGTGRSGKSEFPPWPDNEVIQAIELVANSSGSTKTAANHGREKVSGSHKGIAIEVIIARDGVSIITGYPTNTPRNP